MQNRFIQATYDFTRQNASRSAAWAIIVRDTLSGLFMTARHTVMLVGLLAIGGIALVLTKPEIAAHALTFISLSESEPTKTAKVEPTAMPVLAATADRQSNMKQVSLDDATAELYGQQQRLSNWISKRYRVAGDATQVFVSTAYQTAMELKLDPLLILSVMAIESRFNPFAESHVGAQGLMQVMSRIHKDKFEKHGGVEAALNPIANIKVGSRILKEYVRRGGSVEAGLKMYVGAAAMETDFGYGAKVLAEYERMKAVAMGKKVSIHATTKVPRPPETATHSSPAQEAATASEQPAQPLAEVEQLASAL